jgi:uncharacterized membrane protein
MFAPVTGCFNLLRLLEPLCVVGSTPGVSETARLGWKDFTMSNGKWPTFWHLHPGVRQREQLSLGERAADRMRNIMGSWPFVLSFFAVMILWAALNTYFLQRVIHHKAFDPYPYILLNLFLSMLAGVQAAALLIAAKRTDSIASEIALHTVKNTDDIRALLDENTNLTKQVKEATDLLDEIHRHVAALSPGAGRFPPGGKPPASE